MIRIAVASNSAIKLDAVRDAIASLMIKAEIIGLKTASGVPEQPTDKETLQGARNRIQHAKALDPRAQLYIAIENGIFDEAGRYFDKAVVICLTSAGQEFIATSAGVEFPADCVEEARRIGFDKMTASKIIAQRGLSKQHDDPHLSLAGRPRAQFITETLVTLLRKVFPSK